MVVFALPIPAWLVHGSSLTAEVVRELISCSLTLLLVAYVLLVERRSIFSIGLDSQNGRPSCSGFWEPW